MGLLSNLLGKLTSSNEILSQVKDAIESAAKNGETPHAPASSARPQYTTNYDRPFEREKTAAEWHAYFKEILQTEFSTYSIRENVPVTELAGYAVDEFKLYSTRPRQAYKAEWGQPYTFVLYLGTVPKAVVMLGDGHSHDSNVKYLVARSYAKKLGLPYINFYTQMPNERGYVLSRVRRFLP